MAADRKIQFSSYFNVQESSTKEEGKEVWVAYGPEKGGSRVSITDLLANQWSDNWCSMSGNDKYWESYSDSTDNSGNRWEDSIDGWNNKKLVGTGANQLTQSVGSATDVDVAFLYIKNLGEQEVHVSLNGSSGEYDLLVPAGASLALRGSDDAFHCDDVHVKTASGETYIDYVLARK